MSVKGECVRSEEREVFTIIMQKLTYLLHSNNNNKAIVTKFIVSGPCPLKIPATARFFNTRSKVTVHVQCC